MSTKTGFFTNPRIFLARFSPTVQIQRRRLNARRRAALSRAVKEQSYKNFEHIFIDGGSTDKTLELINCYKNENSIVLSENDDGIYDAFNKGISLASGDLISIFPESRHLIPL